MELVTLHFEDGLIEFDMPSQKGTEFYNFADIQKDVLHLLGLPEDADEIAINFTEETISYTDTSGFTQTSASDLEQKKGRLWEILGYEEADISNMFGLVNALINGEISPETFETLSQVESLKNEASPFVKQFLAGLNHEEDS